MLAVRVPPSACSTSQSTAMVRSPMMPRSTTPRRLRPMSRWISMVRPAGGRAPPRAAVRVGVAAGQHAVLGREPAAARAAQPAGHAVAQRRRAEHDACRRARCAPNRRRTWPPPASMLSGRSSSALRPVLTADPPWPPRRPHRGRQAAGRVVRTGRRGAARARAAPRRRWPSRPPRPPPPTRRWPRTAGRAPRASMAATPRPLTTTGTDEGQRTAGRCDA